MNPQRHPGELVWIHNDMTRSTPGDTQFDRHLIVPSDPAPQPYFQSSIARLRSWAMINPAPDPARCFCITPCYSSTANARLCPKEAVCPPDCHAHGSALHDTVILLSGKTRQQVLTNIVSARHPRQLAHMVPESSMFDSPEQIQPDEHYRHVFKTISPQHDAHCICCHISHSLMWMRCDCGAHACSYCASSAADTYLHGISFS